MKTDKNGISTCEKGRESFEKFKNGRKSYIQYDFRTETGKLFSCCAPSLEDARKKRDNWLSK